MSSSQPVSHFDINERLLGVVGITITHEVSRKYTDYISSLFYCFGLDYKSLPEVQSTDGSATSFSPGERRLRGMLRVSIALINELAAKIAELAEQNGTYTTDAVSLSTKTKEMASLLSTQNAEIENHYTEVAEYQKEVNDLAAQLDALKIQHVTDMLDNENNGQRYEFSEEVAARLREHVTDLQATILNRERVIGSLEDEGDELVRAKDELKTPFQYGRRFENLKRNAAEDLSTTPSKKPNQGSISRVASPSSLTDVAKRDLNPSIFSSEDEDDASEDPGPSSTDISLSDLIIIESDEEKEPEDDGHPEAGNSAAEICTPKPPIFGTPDLTKI